MDEVAWKLSLDGHRAFQSHARGPRTPGQRKNVPEGACEHGTWDVAFCKGPGDGVSGWGTWAWPPGPREPLQTAVTGSVLGRSLS